MNSFEISKLLNSLSAYKTGGRLGFLEGWVGREKVCGGILCLNCCSHTEGCWVCFLSVKLLIKGIFIVIVLDVYRKFKEIA